MGQRLHKSSRVSQHDKAILKVKTLRDTVKIYQKKVEQSLTFEQQLAVQLLQAGKREKAKCILRKRMALEDHLRATDGHLENVEKMINHLESSSVVQKVLDGLKAGNKALKKANEALNIKNVETLLEETALGIQKQAEINEIIRGLTREVSDELIEEELNALIRNKNSESEMPRVDKLKMNKPEEKPKEKIIEETKEIFPSTSSPYKNTEKKKKKEKISSKPKKLKSTVPKQIGIVINGD